MIDIKWLCFAYRVLEIIFIDVFIAVVQNLEDIPHSKSQYYCLQRAGTGSVLEEGTGKQILNSAK